MILYGTNDFSFGIDPADTGAHTRIMIDIARANGFTPVVSPLLPRNPANAGSEVQNLTAYNSQITSAINDRGADSVDLYSRFINEPGGFQNLMDIENNDFLHPSDRGYLVIAETWFDQFLDGRIAAEPLASNVTIAPVLFLLLDDE